MQTIPIKQAAHHLAEIIEKLPAGEEVILTRHEEPVAILRSMPQAPNGQRQLGTLKGSVLSVSSDFDEIPEGFEDYLP